jgi:probable F420-dependent oxidoreductase
MRPFRFGTLAEHAQTPDQLLGTARRAEDLAYSALLIRDHLVEGPSAHQLAPPTSLAAVAAVTTRLRVGTQVLCNEFRHPAVLAKEIATLDVLSGGRVELGLGAGFLQREFDQAGMPFEPPGTRVDRLEETLRVLKGLFAAGPLTHHGDHYHVDGLDTFPKPVQRPHPPILVGAGRPRMLSIAAREADIVGILTVSTGGGVMTDDPETRTPEAVGAQIDRVRRAAGDRFEQLELAACVLVVIVAGSYERQTEGDPPRARTMT